MKLAIGQSPAELNGVAARLAWLKDAAAECATQGADLLLLPELSACGYNIGDQVRSAAQASGGPITQAISTIAKHHGIAIAYGYAEQGGTQIYNAAQCIGPDGAALGHHRKLAIPPGFERDVFAAGRGCTLFQYAGLTFAILICYDAEFGETVRHVASLGAEVVLVPTALGAQWGWVADTMMPTRAYENGVYFAYANSAGSENGMEFLGRSVIAAPNGQEAARAGAAPRIIYADIDADVVRAAQSRLPYLADIKSVQMT